MRGQKLNYRYGKVGEPPCHGCDERKVGCHSDCGQYKSWRSSYDEVKAKADEAKSEEEYITSYGIGRAIKNRKKVRVV